MQIKNFDYDINKLPVGIRVGIFGGSGSGKTTLLLDHFIPVILKQYHIIYVIMDYDPDLVERYKNAIKKYGGNRFIMEGDKKIKVPIVYYRFPDDIEDLEKSIDDIYNFQKKTNKKYNILVLMDDVMKIDGLNKSKKFQQCFTNFRHFSASIFILIQTTQATISSTVIANMSYIVFFPINQSYFINTIRREYIDPSIIKYINTTNMNAGKIVKQYPKENDMKRVTMEIYQKYIGMYPFGHAMLFDKMNTTMYAIDTTKKK